MTSAFIRDASVDGYMPGRRAARRTRASPWPPGRFKIKADAPDEKLEETIRLGPTLSPVHDTVTNTVNVEVGLET